MPCDPVERWEWEGGAVAATENGERAQPVVPFETDQPADTGQSDEQPTRTAAG